MVKDSLTNRLGQLPANLFRRNDRRAVAKLTPNERCSILAFHFMGVPTQILADHFGVTTQTVVHIYSPGSPHYKKTREEVMQYNSPRMFCIDNITEWDERQLRLRWPAMKLPDKIAESF